MRKLLSVVSYLALIHLAWHTEVLHHVLNALGRRCRQVTNGNRDHEIETHADDTNTLRRNAE